MGLFRKIFGRNKFKNDVSSDMDDFLKNVKKHPEVEDIIKNSIKDFGADPVPKIIQQTISEGVSRESQIMSSMLLSYIGEPAIPSLVECLGGNNDNLAMFAAKTLANIEGSIPILIKSLKNENPKTRYHAAGAFQFCGKKAIEAIPDLCELIKFEIYESGTTDPAKIPDAAENAAGALGKMDDAAIPCLRDLLKENNANIRLCAVSALLRIGKPALNLLNESKEKENDKLVLTALEDTINRIENAKD